MNENEDYFRISKNGSVHTLSDRIQFRWKELIIWTSASFLILIYFLGFLVGIWVAILTLMGYTFYRFAASIYYSVLEIDEQSGKMTRKMKFLHKVQKGLEPPNHPLISLMTCKELMTYGLGDSRFTGNFYMIALKKIKSGYVLYGKTAYDHSNGSMVFMKPRQVIEVSNVQFAEKGFVLFFHEEYLMGHNLFEQIKKYGYFEYEINEALHISPSEETILWELYYKIRGEYDNTPDEFSREIILSHVDAMLKYSDRFYNRQFLDRSLQVSGHTIQRFQKVLADYFQNKSPKTNGLPSVNQLADELFLSPRYLSDVLKKETGKTALEHIHIFLIKEAKNLLIGTENNVSEIAYELGFDSPSYFTRLFKKQTDMRPLEFRTNA